MMLAGSILTVGTGCTRISAQGKNSEGVHLFNQARYLESLEQFQTASYRDPENADAYYNLAATYHRLGTIHRDSEQWTQAEHYYNQCLDKDENHTACYRGLAVLLIEEGRRDEAFRLLQGWVDRQPNLADARIELARLHEECGNRESAKEHLLEAVSIDHQNARALAALGNLREQSGEYAQALSNYRESLRYDRFQDDLAARVAALQSAATPSQVIMSPSGGTRMVNASGATLR
jgi:Tfp pilus assembly protein PilF